MTTDNVRNEYDHDKPKTLAKYLLWICLFIGAIAATSIVWMFGITPWSVFGFALLVACPLVVLWVLRSMRRGGSARERKT